MIMSVGHASVDASEHANVFGAWSELVVGDRPDGLIDCYLLETEGAVQITAVWKTIAPAIGKADDMIVKPVLTEVVPRVLAPLSMFSSEENKKAEERKAMIDTSATPEVVPALN